ncbi:MAG TPA: hypothetical protein VNC50_06115, partial [Planctomycetia bacterium]|nr:hypothetical protein [Planctomycetia bacterium]
MNRGLLFLAVFFFAVGFNRGELSSVDEGFIYRTTQSLVDRGSWRMDEELSGRRLSRFSPLPSLLAAPAYFIGQSIVPPGPRRDERLLFVTELTSCLLVALTAVALSLWVAELGGGSGFRAALLWFLATFQFAYSSTLYHQIPATLFATLAFRAYSAERARSAGIWFAMMVFTQTNLAVLPLGALVFGSFLGAPPSRKLLFTVLAGVAAGAAG